MYRNNLVLIDQESNQVVVQQVRKLLQVEGEQVQVSE